MTETRGIRNRNPGNIDHNDANPWQGELPVDKAKESRFCRFDTPENGIRALAKVLLTYFKKYNLKTPRAIVNRWAPPKENNTDAYVNQVAKFLGVGADDQIDLTRKALLTLLVVAIIKHENAGFMYPAGVVLEGVERALR